MTTQWRWNLEEFKALCTQKGISYPTKYCNSLMWHWYLADFHKEMAEEVWNDLFKSPFSIGDENDKRLAIAWFKYEAYFVASIQSLHPMADTLDQIINIAFINPPLPEEKVKKTIISAKLNDIKSVASVKSSRDELYDSDEFNYINAFCNIIKHRHHIRVPTLSTEGCYDGRFLPIINSFEYNGKTYPETGGMIILDTYLIGINRFIVNVGLNINACLKNI